jgi:uncharacterized protein YdeI (YjbR/CyaY-like superfamily)
MSGEENALPIELFRSADAWAAWLEENHSTSTGVWLKIGKKSSGIITVTYDEALDVALCFGWIDGQRKALDEQHFLQKFTHRRKRSLWSKRNVEKVANLIGTGRMRPEGQAEIDAAQLDGRWQQAYAGPRTMEVPADFRTALESNPAALTFFETLNKSQRYSFLWRIETAKKAETRQRRIDQFVTLLAENKLL